MVVEIKSPALKTIPEKPKACYMAQMLAQAKCYSQVMIFKKY